VPVRFSRWIYYHNPIILYEILKLNWFQYFCINAGGFELLPEQEDILCVSSDTSSSNNRRIILISNMRINNTVISQLWLFTTFRRVIFSFFHSGDEGPRGKKKKTSFVACISLNFIHHKLTSTFHHKVCHLLISPGQPGLSVPSPQKILKIEIDFCEIKRHIPDFSNVSLQDHIHYHLNIIQLCFCIGQVTGLKKGKSFVPSLPVLK
jgi:hypothetical protein